MNGLPLVAALTSAALVIIGGWPAAGWSGDLSQDCLALSRSHGRVRNAIANRIGREQYLTRDHLQVDDGDEGNDSGVCHYRWSDIQRACGR